MNVQVGDGVIVRDTQFGVRPLIGTISEITHPDCVPPYRIESSATPAHPGEVAS